MQQQTQYAKCKQASRRNDNEMSNVAMRTERIKWNQIAPLNQQKIYFIVLII